MYRSEFALTGRERKADGGRIEHARRSGRSGAVRGGATLQTAALATLIGLVACSGGSGAATPTVGDAAGLAPSPSPPAASAAAVLGPDDWNTYAHDMARTGSEQQPTGITPDTVSQLQLRWTYNNGSGGVYQASPIVTNGVAYVADSTGIVSALDAKTGKLKWSYNLGFSAAMTPALYDGILFVGTHWQWGQLFALDPATGTKLWSQPVAGGLRGSPVAVNGSLYVGTATGDSPWCAAGGVYEYDEKTGAPAPFWLTEISNPSDGGGVWSPITYDGANLYFGTGNTCRNEPATAVSIVATSTNLQLLWNVQTASPTSDNDVGSGVLVRNGVAYVTGKNRKLYAVDVLSGQVVWSEELGLEDATAPLSGPGGIASPTFTSSTLLVSGGATQNPVLVAIPGGTLYGISATDGSSKWSIKTQYQLKSYVAVTPDLAFAELDDTVDALDPATGNVLWSYKTKGDFDSSSPVIVPSGLYVADASGTVYAFGLPSRSQSATRLRASAGRRWSPSYTSLATKYRPMPPPKFCETKTRLLRRSFGQQLH